jgi:hypothetical protein
MHDAAAPLDSTVAEQTSEASDDFELTPGSQQTAPAANDFELTPFDVEPVPQSQAAPATESKPGASNPFLARLDRDKQLEMSERARLWAEMRHRERRADMVSELEESRPEKEARERSPWVGRILKIAVAAAVLIGAGGGLFYWLSHRDSRITAEEVWQEFANDNQRAGERYKGKFVQVSGKVIVQTTGKSSRLAFEPPKDAKWRIEFALRSNESEGIKSGQELTVRGKFAQRRNPEANLMLSNCNLMKEN